MLRDRICRRNCSKPLLPSNPRHRPPPPPDVSLESPLESLASLPPRASVAPRVSAGPRVSGIDALKRTIAVERIKAAFKSYSAKTGKTLSLPTKDETVDYMGKAMTRDDLIKAMLDKQGAAIEAEAKRRQEFQSEGADVGEDLF